MRRSRSSPAAAARRSWWSCAPGGTANRRNIGCAPWRTGVERGAITDEGVDRLRARIGVAQPHPQPPHYRLPERGRVPPRRRGLRRRQPAVVRSRPRHARPCGRARSRRRTSSAATRSSARTRSRRSIRRRRGAAEGRPARAAPTRSTPAASASGGRRCGRASDVGRRNALVGVHDKQSEFADRAVHEWTAEVFAARDPDVALAAQYRLMIRTERDEGARSGKYDDDRDPARTPTTRSRAIDAAYADERTPARRRAALVGGRRGGRRGRPAREGPAARHRHGLLARRHGHGPLRREGAAPRLPAAPAGAAVLPARRPQHPRRAAARALGPRVGARGPATRQTYDYGRMRETWLIHLCTDWMGDDAWLWKLDCEFRKFNYVGDTHWMRGRVTRKLPRRRRPAGGRPRRLGREPAGRDHHARATPRSCCRAASTGRSGCPIRPVAPRPVPGCSTPWPPGSATRSSPDDPGVGARASTSRTTARCCA